MEFKVAHSSDGEVYRYFTHGPKRVWEMEERPEEIKASATKAPLLNKSGCLFGESPGWMVHLFFPFEPPCWSLSRRPHPQQRHSGGGGGGNTSPGGLLALQNVPWCSMAFTRPFPYNSHFVLSSLISHVRIIDVYRIWFQTAGPEKESLISSRFSRAQSKITE